VTLIWGVLRGGKGSIRPKVRFENSAYGQGLKDASRTEDKTQKKIAKYPIGRTQLASIPTKPTLLRYYGTTEKLSNFEIAVAKLKEILRNVKFA